MVNIKAEIYKIIRNLETSSFLFYQPLKVLLDVEWSLHAGLMNPIFWKQPSPEVAIWKKITSISEKVSLIAVVLIKKITIYQIY